MRKLHNQQLNENFYLEKWTFQTPLVLFSSELDTLKLEKMFFWCKTKPLISTYRNLTLGKVTFLIHAGHFSSLFIFWCSGLNRSCFCLSDSEVVYRNRDGHVIKFNFALNETEVILSNSTFVSFVFSPLLKMPRLAFVFYCIFILLYYSVALNTWLLWRDIQNKKTYTE